MDSHPNTRHGHCRRGNVSETYKTWASMHRRCSLPSQDNYQDYGGRGISVCERWNDFSNFLLDMGEKPVGLSIERLDFNGNYCPENCTWANASAQARNRRSGRFVTHNGETLPVFDWAERTGVPSHVIRARLDKLGWTIDKALFSPLVPQEVSIKIAAGKQLKAPIDEYIKALESGESCASIASRYNVTASGIVKAMQRRGLSVGDYTQTTEARRLRGQKIPNSTKKKAA